MGENADDGGGVIYATTDGGRSWHQQQAEAFGGLNAVAFADPSNGWVVGSNGVLLATTDGGTSWAQHRRAAEDDVGTWLCDVACADDKHVWAVGDGIFFSSDGGAFWSRQDSRECLGVACADERQAWVASGGRRLLVTDDGGASWRAERGRPSPPLVLEAVVCDESGGVWTGGFEGMVASPASPDAYVLWSRDGGDTWHRQVFTADSINDLALSALGRVWAVGARGRIYSSSDGGRHWKVHRLDGAGASSDDIELDGIAFSDERHGWAVGLRNHPSGENQGVIYGTTDGGRTWTRQALVKQSMYFNDVGCVPL